MRRIANRSTIITPVAAPSVVAVATSSTQIQISATYAGIAAFQLFIYQFALSSSGPWTTLYTTSAASVPHIGLTASTTYYYRVIVQAFAVGNSPASAVTSATTQASTSSSKKFPPPQFGGNFLGGVTGPSQTNINTRIAQYAADIAAGATNIMFYTLPTFWWWIEPYNGTATTQGTNYGQYSSAAFIQDLVYLAEQGKYLILKIYTYGHAGGAQTPANVVPSYIFNSISNGSTMTDTNYSSSYGNGYYGANAGYNQDIYRVAYWNTGVVTAFIAMLKWVMQVCPISIPSGPWAGNYVGAESCPAFLGVVVDEETTSSNMGFCLKTPAQGNPNGPGYGTNTYSADNWNIGYKTLIQQCGALCPTTNCGIPMNFCFTTNASALAAEIVLFGQTIAAAKCCWMPPDCLPYVGTIPSGTGLTSVVNGITYKGTHGAIAYLGGDGTNVLPGGQNYQGVIPWCGQIEGDDYAGGSIGQNFTLQQLWNYYMGAYPNLQGTMTSWGISTSGAAAQIWSSAVRPFLQANPVPATPNNVAPPGY